MRSADYPTCKETFVTFRLYPGQMEPDRVTQELGIEPSEVQQEGELRGERRLRLNGWFLSSSGKVDSLDTRRHLDWLLARLEGAKRGLGRLRASGAKMDISCYWLSAHGHSGPVLSPPQARQLAELGLDCWFDVYFDDE